MAINVLNRCDCIRIFWELSQFLQQFTPFLKKLTYLFHIGLVLIQRHRCPHDILLSTHSRQLFSIGFSCSFCLLHRNRPQHHIQLRRTRGHIRRHIRLVRKLTEVRMGHKLRGHAMEEPVDVLAIGCLLCCVHVALYFPYFGMLFFSSYACASALALEAAALKAAIAAAEATLASTIGAGYAVLGTFACTFASTFAPTFALTYSRTFGSFQA